MLGTEGLLQVPVLLIKYCALRALVIDYLFDRAPVSVQWERFDSNLIIDCTSQITNLVPVEIMTLHSKSQLCFEL